MKRASLSETVFTDVDNATYSKLIDITLGTVRLSAREYLERHVSIRSIWNSLGTHIPAEINYPKDKPPAPAKRRSLREIIYNDGDNTVYEKIHNNMLEIQTEAAHDIIEQPVNSQWRLVWEHVRVEISSNFGFIQR